MKKKNFSSNHFSRKAARQKNEKNEIFLGTLESNVNKMMKSPALNGGFDTLIHKVDKIEESQGKILQSVENIHAAIYHEDDGLFARIKTSDAKRENEIALIKNWKEIVDKELEKDEEKNKTIEEKLQTHQKSIDEVVKWKSTVNTVTKAVLGLLATSAVTLLFKLLYDWLSVYMKVH